MICAERYVVSGGMPKSGSTLLTYFLTMLVGHTHGWSGRLAFTKWVSGDASRGSGEYLHDGWEKYRTELLQIATDHGPFVVKTHSESPPSVWNGPRFPVVYSIRDPRDVVLSAMDHARRSSNSGSGEFIRHLSEEESLKIVGEWCDRAANWLKHDDVIWARYEDLVTHPEVLLARISTRLDLDTSKIPLIIEKERSIRAKGTNRFNTGRFRRFDSEMSADLLERCNVHFAERMKSLGYPCS